MDFWKKVEKLMNHWNLLKCLGSGHLATAFTLIGSVRILLSEMIAHRDLNLDHENLHFSGFSDKLCLLGILRLSATACAWSTAFFLYAMMLFRYVAVSFPILPRRISRMKSWRYPWAPFGPHCIFKSKGRTVLLSIQMLDCPFCPWNPSNLHMCCGCAAW